MDKELNRTNKLIDTAFEHLSPMDYDAVITGLQKEKENLTERNKEIANWCNEQTGEIRRQAKQVTKLQSSRKALKAALLELYDIWCIAEHQLEDADYNRAVKLKLLANKELDDEL